MKAIIEFDLDNPEDASAHRLMLDARKMASAIFQITHNAHRRFEDNEEALKGVQACVDIINDYGIDLGNLD